MELVGLITKRREFCLNFLHITEAENQDFIHRGVLQRFKPNQCQPGLGNH